MLWCLCAVHVRNRRPGFAPRQDKKVLKESIEVLLCIIDLKCNVYVFTWEIKSLAAPKIHIIMQINKNK
jgi:hypothetical protein